MRDRLFDAKRCERCNMDLSGNARTMSWFTEETICWFCSQEESKIKKKLPYGGRNHEGCGYIPKVDDGKSSS